MIKSCFQVWPGCAVLLMLVGALATPQLKVPLQPCDYLFLHSLWSCDMERRHCQREATPLKILLGEGPSSLKAHLLEKLWNVPFMTSAPAATRALCSLCHQSSRKEGGQARLLLPELGEILSGGPGGDFCAHFLKKHFEKKRKALEHSPGLQGWAITVSPGGKYSVSPTAPLTTSLKPTGYRREGTPRGKEDQTLKWDSGEGFCPWGTSCSGAQF